MMGPKKLSEIKKELRQALGSQSAKIRAWLDREHSVHRADRGKSLAEELRWIQDYLQKAPKRTKSRPEKPLKAKKKKTSVT